MSIIGIVLEYEKQFNIKEFGAVALSMQYIKYRSYSYWNLQYFIILLLGAAVLLYFGTPY